MGSHRKLSDWYTQIAQSLNAGMGLVATLEGVGGPGGKPIGAWVNLLKSGQSIDRALSEAPRWLPENDRLLLSAGAESGRLTEVCRALAGSHERMDANLRQWRQALFYPAFLFHLSVLLYPLMDFGAVLSVSERGGKPFSLYYLEKVLPILVGVWLGIWILKYLWSRFEIFGAVASWVLPGLRGFRRETSIARFSEALEALLEAGVSVEEAYGGAAMVAGPSRVRDKVLEILPRLRMGDSPARLFEERGIIKGDYLKLFQTGMTTGQLTESLLRINRIANDRATDRLKQMQFWYTKAIYLLAAVWVAWQAMQSMEAYLKLLEI